MLDINLLDYLAGALFNLFIALIIVRLIYYPVTQDKQYVLTFLTFSTITYFVLGLLTSVNLSIGVGFGLFAIFSVLRYRTDEMPAREMTYLFVFIALPIMNSVLISSGDLPKMLVSNAMIIVLLFVLEKEWGFRFEDSRRITYDRIDLISPDKREALIADLSERTGLAVRSVEIGRIDLVRDSAEITVVFDEPTAPAQAPPGAGGTAEPHDTHRA